MSLSAATLSRCPARLGARVTVPGALRGASRTISFGRRQARGHCHLVVLAQVAQPQGQELALQFMVDMKCQGCVTAVKNSLADSQGVSRVDVDLGAQTVVVVGTASVEDVQAALSGSGRKSRLIGQGSGGAEFSEDLAKALGMDMRTLRQSLAGVVEYKGKDWGQGDVIGVVRFVQVTQTSVRVEAALSGLRPGPHSLVIHTSGDVTGGVASVGSVFSPEGAAAGAGFVCSFAADAQGNASIRNALLNPKVQVWDIVGRSLVVHSGETPGASSGVVAGVIARSAAVGDNADKKICACDGTVIWDADGKLTKVV